MGWGERTDLIPSCYVLHEALIWAPSLTAFAPSWVVLVDRKCKFGGLAHHGDLLFYLYEAEQSFLWICLKQHDWKEMQQSQAGEVLSAQTTFRSSWLIGFYNVISCKPGKDRVALRMIYVLASKPCIPVVLFI